MVGTDRRDDAALEDSIRELLALLIDYKVALHTID